MSDWTDRYGPWALVTGASSGIGQGFARQLAARGVHLVLVARRAERLESLGAELSAAHGIKTRSVPLDLTREDFLPELLSATEDLEVGLIVCSAGFALTGDFLDHELDRELALLHVNCRAPMLLCHAYGRTMRDRKRGGIILLSSIAGFGATPRWTTIPATPSCQHRPTIRRSPSPRRWRPSTSIPASGNTD